MFELYFKVNFELSIDCDDTDLWVTLTRLNCFRGIGPIYKGERNNNVLLTMTNQLKMDGQVRYHHSLIKF